MTLTRAFFAVVFAASLPPLSAARAETTALASHRAVYELTLDKATGSKAPAQARGRIVFDFSASCDGYVQNFRQITELQPAEGATKLSDMLSATFEALDASNYRFKVETKIDNASAEAVDGKAQKSRDGRVAVDLSRPKRAHLDLDGPALFPSEHLRHIVEAARKGDSLLEAQVYDGTGEGDKAFDTLTVIGKSIEAPAGEKAAQADALKGMKRWRVSVSYFEPGKRDGQPIYVLSFDLYENGVSRALKLDYGDFVLKGDMTELTIQPAASCKK
ncbi:cell envelope integrity EipB family protein [Methylocystis sp. JAN1]|uniref:cell envelope integrity EipB family protein n=1 Tax=Methylocystis sp. JAN1 TaxID=3397211 RepID=UPI003FA20BAE